MSIDDHYWTVPPIWAGQTAFILGCGPSLEGFRASRLHGRNIITINDSFLLAPWSEILYFCDLKWWKANEFLVSTNFQGRLIITMSSHIYGVKTLRCSGATGLETDPMAVRHGSNSGYQAINLAYHLGAKRIILLGYDMRVHNNGRMHWRHRSDLQTPAGFSMTIRDSMLPKFQSICAPLEKAGIRVINCTPNSALTVWPMMPLEQALQDDFDDFQDHGAAVPADGAAVLTGWR